MNTDELHDSLFQGLKTERHGIRTIAPRGDKRYIPRDEQSRIAEPYDVGLFLSHDVKKKAEDVSESGQRETGDGAHM